MIKLFNTIGLAKEIGIGRTGIAAMKRMGFKFLYGRLTTVESVLEWMHAHPDFRQSQAYPLKKPVPKERRTLESRRKAMMKRIEDHENVLMRGEFGVS